jgi:hypothetical protein
MLLKDLTCYSIGQQGIGIHYNSHDITVDNALVHDTGTGTVNGEGIYVGSSTSITNFVDNTYNITVQHSTFYNTKSEGIELKPGTHDCIVDNNTFYHNGADGSGAAIEVDGSTPPYQPYALNHNHIVRNNIVHDPLSGVPAIHLNTGSTAYNNVIYSVASPSVGFSLTNGADSASTDTYPRNVYHNTIDVTSARAIASSGGPTTDIKNNIGPTSTNNMATNSAYYVNAASADYHLVSGAAPIDAGLNLTATVPTDKDGVTRPQGSAPDLGAYEYVAGSRPNPPTNLTVIVQ